MPIKGEVMVQLYMLMGGEVMKKIIGFFRHDLGRITCGKLCGKLGGFFVEKTVEKTRYFLGYFYINKCIVFYSILMGILNSFQHVIFVGFKKVCWGFLAVFLCG
jgi:hypothetical protein